MTAKILSLIPSSLRDVSIASIRIGAHSHVSIYGFTAEQIGVALVEFRYLGETINLTVDQADAIAAGLMKAAAKARGDSSA